ncbi:hypothetical protein, partial [Pseudomonas viridiflava]|uniref:hypothetical protein n=1 Tax=Pseudomonas viridiflava TaxID=33069 RepID=UPI001ADAAB83
MTNDLVVPQKPCGSGLAREGGFEFTTSLKHSHFANALCRETAGFSDHRSSSLGDIFQEQEVPRDDCPFE